MAHSGNPLDKAPIVDRFDITSVARPREQKSTPVARKRTKANVTVDTTTTLPNVPLGNVVVPRTIAEPRAVEKDEVRLPTETLDITLNILDERLGYYVDRHNYVYKFEELDLVCVGKHTPPAVKLSPIDGGELKTLLASIQVRYVYDNNYFL